MQSTNTFELARYGADLQRRMHDMPIGDPMAGAPYGEYLKSKGLGMVIGIVASIVTMGAAAPLLASTVLATQIAGGVMMAGGVLSGVGAVTGNKKLAKIGGIMSLAGGIGGLASGALNSAGAGGAFASGSGSEAVATMSSNFMDSASSMSGGLAYGDRVAGAGAEKVAGEFAQSNAGVAAEPVAAGTITPDNISNGPPGAPVEQVPDGTIKLADTPANTGSTDVGANLMGETPGGATGITAPAAPGDALKFSAGDPNGGIIKNELAKSGANDSMLSGANKFLGDNKELLKTGANALEMGVKYGMGGDAAVRYQTYEDNTSYKLLSLYRRHRWLI